MPPRTTPTKSARRRPTTADPLPPPAPGPETAGEPTPAAPAAPPPPFIRCAHSALVPPGELRPHPRNPNRHPPEQVRLLAKIIGATGFRSPIVVSARSGFITKGHGRLEAAVLAGLPVVPVDFQTYDSDEAELADMLADNRLAELAVMDTGGLKDLLIELDTGAFDMDLTGFTEEALAAMMGATPPDDAGADEGGTFASQYAVTVLCKDEADQRALFERLTAEGHDCKVVCV